MGRFGAQLLGLVTILLPLGLLVAAPVVAFVATGRRPWWQVLAATFGGYLFLAPLVGLYAYVVVPADYTVRHAWTRHPVSSSLSDQHGHALEVAAARAARAPHELAAVRERVGLERRAYLADWLRLTLAGLALPALAMLWWGIRRRRSEISPLPPPLPGR